MTIGQKNRVPIVPLPGLGRFTPDLFAMMICVILRTVIAAFVAREMALSSDYQKTKRSEREEIPFFGCEVVKDICLRDSRILTMNIVRQKTGRYSNMNSTLQFTTLVSGIEG